MGTPGAHISKGVGRKGEEKFMKTTFQNPGKVAGMAVAALCIMFAPHANACGNPTKGQGLNGLTRAPMLALRAALLAPNSDAAVAGNQAGENSPFIVGMWEVTMQAGGVLYDHAYQQLYADGNEMQNSGIFPPEVGNICFGVWKQQDARTFKLKHYGWLFDKGAFTGTYILTATITVGTPTGANTYSGSFVADVVLPSGTIDPTQHAEGTMRGVRLLIE
jgi:hypothetical protein